MFHFIRLLRTTSSERYVIQRASEDIGTCDLHFMPGGGRVVATLFLLTSANVVGSDIDCLIQQVDEHLLPEVRRESDSLVFTLVQGEVLGAYSTGNLLNERSSH